MILTPFNVFPTAATLPKPSAPVLTKVVMRMVLSYIPITIPSTRRNRPYSHSDKPQMMNNTPAKTLRRLTDLETGSCASVARIKLDAAEEARPCRARSSPRRRNPLVFTAKPARHSHRRRRRPHRRQLRHTAKRHPRLRTEKKDPLSCFSRNSLPAPAAGSSPSDKEHARIPPSSPEGSAPRPAPNSKLVRMIAPLGDPVEIRVRGSMISVRRDEAAIMELSVD